LLIGKCQRKILMGAVLPADKTNCSGGLGAEKFVRKFLQHWNFSLGKE